MTTFYLAGFVSLDSFYLFLYSGVHWWFAITYIDMTNIDPYMFHC